MDPNAYRAELQKLVQERDLSQKDAGRLPIQNSHQFYNL